MLGTLSTSVWLVLTGLDIAFAALSPVLVSFILSAPDFNESVRVTNPSLTWWRALSNLLLPAANCPLPDEIRRAPFLSCPAPEVSFGPFAASFEVPPASAAEPLDNLDIPLESVGTAADNSLPPFATCWAPAFKRGALAANWPVPFTNCALPW